MRRNRVIYNIKFRQRPRRAIFSHKGGRKKAQYYSVLYKKENRILL